ncbi:hypothetical protein CBFG_02371 [Clostridiales bacterium 1_7_47FAA]|nr:hypothetical protein CBFG_02371 [Clostridiales bacterium 1_7_47FAA]
MFICVTNKKYFKHLVYIYHKLSNLEIHFSFTKESDATVAKAYSISKKTGLVMRLRNFRICIR